MATKDLDFGNVIKQVYDPASEALQVTVVSGGGSGGATAAKQDQQTAILTTLDTSTNAVEASTASIDTKLTPLSVLGSFSIDFSNIPDSSSAPFEITAGVLSAVKRISVYDTTGETMQIRTGATTGALLLYTGPGQDNLTDALIALSTRISIRSNGSAPTAGSYIITLLG